jgi:hypothetical protein
MLLATNSLYYTRQQTTYGKETFLQKGKGVRAIVGSTNTCILVVDACRYLAVRVVRVLFCFSLFLASLLRHLRLLASVEPRLKKSWVWRVV